MKAFLTILLTLFTLSTTVAHSDEIEKVQIRQSGIMFSGGLNASYLGMTPEVDKVLASIGPKTALCDARITQQNINLSSGTSVFVKIWDLQNCSIK